MTYNSDALRDVDYDSDSSCNDCYAGTNKDNCGDCSGSGSVDCSACDGTGDGSLSSDEEDDSD